ncbi:MAG: UvrD-helicase domain-containing protein [Methanomassiliicoccaceae archaeon]|nr:UvrD-helicase domain-containing protein [Methanomassiliicoccaceae archaeon]
MTELNDGQRMISETTDGIVVVDAGPGTGKTHTIVKRYMNILKKDVDPSEILLLTFTRNAAAEMEERVKSEMIRSGYSKKAASVRSSTFDSFCLNAVMESPETVSKFFKTKETLTRSAKLVQNETLDKEYFRNVYTKFIRRYGRMYGNVPALVGTSYDDLYNVIQRLMSIGVIPEYDGDWFCRDKSILTGKKEELISLLNKMKISLSGDISEEKITKDVTEKDKQEAVNDPRNELLRFIHGVYYEFIRSSISDNRLTFGLNALFAFIILYENKNIRKMMSFRYVMIDEFQDTNELQFLTSLLILREPNLCAVGDWKQGIYGFRYASIENITKFGERLELMKKFLNKGEKRILQKMPDALPLSLTENYRSSQLVIDTAFNALRCKASQDDTVDEKWLNEKVTELVSRRDTEYSEIERICAPDDEGEIKAIIQKITEYINDPRYMIIENDGTARRPEYRDIAVLCRNGSMCIKIKDAAEGYKIPAHLQGDVSVMNTREGKLLLAWLRYVNDVNDIRGPVAILADAGYCLAELRTIFSENIKIPDELKEQRKKLLRKRHRVNDLLTSIFLHHKLNNDITHSLTATISSAHGGNMLTIPGIIRLMEKDMAEGSKYNVDTLLDDRSVMIQTMHKSKGLEYPIVIVGGLRTSVMPSSQNKHGSIAFDPLYGVRITKEYDISDGHHRIRNCWKWDIVKEATSTDKDGERRLFFVALSRAKQYITITSFSNRTSTFFRDVCDVPVRDNIPTPKAAPLGDVRSVNKRPVLNEYERRRKRISLHEIIGRYEESGGGKGTEFGIRVHKDAQRIMNGMDASSDTDEIRYIKKIYDSVKNAKILTEIDCTLPVNDVVIGGRIDMLAIFDDRAEIHDFKTDMNRNNEDRYIMQLSVYAHSASSLGMPVQCVIDYVSQNLSVNVPIMSISEIYTRIAEEG